MINKEQTEFFSKYRDWAVLFINEIAENYGEKELYAVEKALSYRDKEMMYSRYNMDYD
jgi:hypothetical protein